MFIRCASLCAVSSEGPVMWQKSSPAPLRPHRRLPTFYDSLDVKSTSKMKRASGKQHFKNNYIRTVALDRAAIATQSQSERPFTNRCLVPHHFSFPFHSVRTCVKRFLRLRIAVYLFIFAGARAFPILIIEINSRARRWRRRCYPEEMSDGWMANAMRYPRCPRYNSEFT